MDVQVTDWSLEIAEQEFREKVLDASKERPVLVDFWAPWCTPCRVLTPLLEKVVDEYRGALWLVRVNIEKAPLLTQHFQIQGIPLVMMFVDGRPVDQFSGLVPEHEIRRFTERHCTSMSNNLVSKGREKLEQDQLAEANLLFQRALLEREEHHGALLGLAESALREGQLTEAQTFLEQVDPMGTESNQLNTLQAELYFKKACRDFGGLEQTRSQSFENREDLERLYQWACCLAAEQRYEDSLERLLTIVASDRSLRDDGARKTMLKIFGILGVHSPLSEQYRERLSWLLF